MINKRSVTSLTCMLLIATGAWLATPSQRAEAGGLIPFRGFTYVNGPSGVTHVRYRVHQQAQVGGWIVMPVLSGEASHSPMGVHDVTRVEFCTQESGQWSPITGVTNPGARVEELVADNMNGDLLCTGHFDCSQGS